jgi:hypothetical protein
MQTNPLIYEYIEENGGPEAFDPATEPDSFLELCQIILEQIAQGSEAVRSAYTQEELNMLARYYLNLPQPDDEKLA